MEKSRLELTDVDHKPKLFLLENLCNVSNVSIKKLHEDLCDM